MKKALITGATGFLGSRIASELLKKNYKVFAYSSGSSKWRLTENEIEKIYWIYDFKKLEYLIQSECIECFINAAVVYGNISSGENEIRKVNYELPIELMKIFVKNKGGSSKIILFDSFYSKFPDDWTEKSSYTMYKKLLIKEAKNICENLQVANLRLEHLYGPKDSNHKFIPFIINKIVSSDSIVHINSENQKRDFIYIDDVISALFILMKADWQGVREFDCGTGEVLTIGAAVKIINSLCGNIGKFEWRQIKTNSKINESFADTGDLQKYGWKPRFNFKKGIEKILSEYQLKN